MAFVAKNLGGRSGPFSPASVLTTQVVEEFEGGAVKVDEQDVLMMVMTVGEWKGKPMMDYYVNILYYRLG